MITITMMIRDVSMFWFHRNIDRNSYLQCDALVLKMINNHCHIPFKLHMLLGDHHSEERSIVSSSQQSSTFASSFHVLRTIPTIATTTVLPQTRRQSRRVFSRVMNSGNNNDNNINNKYDYSSDDDKSYKRSYNNSHSYRNSNNDNGFLSLSDDDDDVSRQDDDDILSSTAAIATTTAATTVVSLKSSKDIYMKRFKLTSSIVMTTSSYFTSKQIIKSVNAVGYKYNNNNNIKDGAIGYEAAESAFAPGQQQLAVPVLAQSALLNTLPINNLLIGQLQGFIESFVQLLNPSDKQINQIKLNSSVLWSNLRINAQRATGMFLYNQVGTLVDRKLIYYL